MGNSNNWKTAVVDTADAFEALEGWDDLVLAADRPSPYFLHGWLCEWWNHHADLGALSTLVAHDADGRLIAALPLYIRHSHGLRTLEFLGGSQSALSDLLRDPAAPSDLPAGMLRQLPSLPADYMRLFGFPPGSPFADGHLGGSVTVIERVESPILEMPDGWEAAYRRKTNSKKRNHHARRRRQLAELGEVRVEVARTEPELLDALEDCFRLHELRWSGRPDGSDFATPRGRAFQRAAIRRLAALDAARIVTTSIDDRAIAFHYFFLLKRCMYVHRLAFDPEYARFSPGLVNTLDALAAGGSDGATRVEYLGGDERYKLELSDGTKPLMEAIGLPTTLRGRGAVAATTSIVRARKRLKHHRRLRSLYFDRLAPARRVLGRVRH